MFSLILVCFLAFAGTLRADAQVTNKKPAKCTGENGLTRAEINEIINFHNLVRAALKLDALTWDCKLADLAQEWAARGVFEHRTDTTYGESIYVSGLRDIAAVTAIRKWMTEKPSWDNKAGTCIPGKVCTHYTQIVWKKTKQIGCGINRNTPGKWKVLLVCNYNPAGNENGPAY